MTIYEVFQKYLTGEVTRPELEQRMMNANLMHKVKAVKVKK